MARLDSYEGYPEGMTQYLSNYGWHFSKKMCDWAVNLMYKDNGGKKVKIQPITKEELETMFRRYNATLGAGITYDAVYLANMCKADYLGNAVRGEPELVLFVKGTIEDPDGYDGMPLTRFYADCIGKGVPIIWEDML